MTVCMITMKSEIICLWFLFWEGLASFSTEEVLAELGRTEKEIEELVAKDKMQAEHDFNLLLEAGREADNDQKEWSEEFRRKDREMYEEIVQQEESFIEANRIADENFDGPLPEKKSEKNENNIPNWMRDRFGDFDF
eukprot:snap_masked-scaffold_2-processed-gene-15.1-mRNA-1 protein AED:1.00 eAED:1.00 QI:0/0/0/0/1/1/2/0/136